jgi:hypothetical protein
LKKLGRISREKNIDKDGGLKIIIEGNTSRN